MSRDPRLLDIHRSTLKRRDNVFENWKKYITLAFIKDRSVEQDESFNLTSTILNQSKRKCAANAEAGDEYSLTLLAKLKIGALDALIPIRPLRLIEVFPSRSVSSKLWNADSESFASNTSRPWFDCCGRSCEAMNHENTHFSPRKGKRSGIFSIGHAQMVSQLGSEPLNYSRGIYLPQVLPDSTPDALLQA
jgi:hypothetical protein